MRLTWQSNIVSGSTTFPVPARSQWANDSLALRFDWRNFSRNALSAAIAGLWKGLGYRALSTTTHPGMIRARLRSGLWRMHRPPSLARRHEREHRMRHATTRLTAGFHYIGPALPRDQAVLVLGG